MKLFAAIVRELPDKSVDFFKTYVNCCLNRKDTDDIMLLKIFLDIAGDTVAKKLSSVGIDMHDILVKFKSRIEPLLNMSKPDEARALNIINNYIVNKPYTKEPAGLHPRDSTYSDSMRA